MNEWTAILLGRFAGFLRAASRVPFLLLAYFRDYALVPMGLPLPRQIRKGHNKQGEHDGQQKASQLAPTTIFWVFPVVIVGIAGAYFSIDYVVGQKDEGASRLNLLFTAALTVFTAAQALFALRQWQVMNAALDHAGHATEQTQEIIEQMRLEKRAWIGPTKIKSKQPAAGRKIECMISFKNTGQTPGTVRKIMDVTRWQRGACNDDGVANAMLAVATLPFGWVDVQFVVPPNGTITVPVQSQSPLTEDDAAAFEGHTLDLAVAICLEYLDIGGNERTTQCAYRYDYFSKCFLDHQEHSKMT